MKNKAKPEKGEMDDISKLERLNESMKNERVAWEKLIDNLYELRFKNEKNNQKIPKTTNPIKSKHNEK